MSIEITSTAFQPGESIPKQYTGDGAILAEGQLVGKYGR